MVAILPDDARSAEATAPRGEPPRAWRGQQRLGPVRDRAPGSRRFVVRFHRRFGRRPTSRRRRWRRRLPWRAAARSSPATPRPISASTARSTPTAGASMAARIATHGRVSAYLGLSPGLDFESRLFAKPDAARALERELRRPGYECRMIRARHQHRSLPADRAPARDHPPDPRSAGRRQSSRRHHHQIGAGDARPRHPRADGRAQPGARVPLDHHPRPAPRPAHGAARGDPGQAARNHSRASRGARSGRRHGGPGHPRPHRRRDRAHSRGRRLGRRRRGGLRAVASAARGQGTCSANGWPRTSPCARAG